MTSTECQFFQIRRYLCLSTKQNPERTADRLQIAGLDIDKNAIQRIEAGKRFVTDIELKVFSKVLNIFVDDLLN